jgi:predicted dehydrogenase
VRNRDEKSGASARRSLISGTSASCISRFFRRLGVEVVWVCDASIERALAKARRQALPRLYEHFDQFLADDTVDVVHITTPNHPHYSQGKAPRCRKHVVCEKPLALNSTEQPVGSHAELHDWLSTAAAVRCSYTAGSAPRDS